MTWTNAFDTGPCTVTVRDDWTSTELFSAVMAKGDSQPITDGAKSCMLVVSSLGAVSLDGVQVAGAGGGTVSLSVYVTPFDVTKPMRASALTAAVSTSGVGARAMGDSTDIGHDVALDASAGDGTCIPDPCALPAGATVIGIHAEAN